MRTFSQPPIAEIREMAPHSLWYFQAKEWAKTPPKGTNVLWQYASIILVRAVETKTWTLTKLYADRDERFGAWLVLADFGLMVKQARSNSLWVISATLDLVVNNMLGPGWQKKFNAIIAKKRTA